MYFKTLKCLSNLHIEEVHYEILLFKGGNYMLFDKR